MSNPTTSSRAAGIVIHNNQLLVIYRKKNDALYSTFPGGTVEYCASTENCAAREIFEETSIHVKIKNLVYKVEIHSPNFIKYEYFYMAEYVSGVPNLLPNSVEAERITHNNIYQPMWMPLEKISQIKLFPIEIRDKLLENLENGFDGNTLQIKLEKSELKNK